MFDKLLSKADKARAKAAASPEGKVKHDGKTYRLVFNRAQDRQAYDLMLGDGVETRLSAFTMAKAKADALHWLSN